MFPRRQLDTARYLVLLLALLAAGCAKRWPATGMVLRTDPQARTAIISHAAIPGFMDAMVMPFPAPREADWDALHPGARVTFDLVVRRGRSHIERVRAQETAGETLDAIPVLAPPEGEVAPGGLVPDFTLTDQLGRPASLAGFRGRVVAVNFLYTRCPLPDVCPRLASHFAYVQRRFAARMGTDLILLSVTLDPRYDTPERLLRYATIYSAKSEAWRFLTGPEQAIAAVAACFGMHFWAEEGMIVHTSETGIIGRDGRLVARVGGAGFRARELGDLIEEVLKP